MSEVDDLSQITDAAKRERILAIDEKDQMLREYVQYTFREGGGPSSSCHSTVWLQPLLSLMSISVCP